MNGPAPTGRVDGSCVGDVKDADGIGAHVEVWIVDLTDEAISEPRVSYLLDPEERRRAQARTGVGRRRYVASHAALRMILATTLGVEAESLRFGRTCGRCGGHDHGRPWTVGATSTSFSLGHSGDRSIVALSGGVPLGADIEEVRPRVHLDRLALRVLDGDERSEWSALSGRRALVSFLEAWTAKEAYLKATGEGISRPLAEVSRRAPKGWSVARPDVGGGYVAAVVAQAATLRISSRAWIATAAGPSRGAPA